MLGSDHNDGPWNLSSEGTEENMSKVRDSEKATESLVRLKNWTKGTRENDDKRQLESKILENKMMERVQLLKTGLGDVHRMDK